MKKKTVLGEIQHFLEKFTRKKAENRPFFVVLSSGGVDSQVLLTVLSKNWPKNQLLALHIDHNARENSYLDADFVEKYAKSLEIPFQKRRILEKFTKNRENNWRKARKAITEAVLEEISAQKKIKKAQILILTAHHATDLVETTLLRLIKGAGVAALTPFETKTKPFWRLSKAEIVNFAQKNEIPWREDPSNAQKTFDRNKIRSILPLFREINPHLEQVFHKNALRFTSFQHFIHDFVKKMPNPMPKASFLALTDFEKGEFLRFYAQKTPSQAEINDFLRWIGQNPEGNSQKTVGGTIFQLKKGLLIIKKS